MGKWSDLAKARRGHDNSDVSDKSPDDGPNVTNVANVTGGIEPFIVKGLAALQSSPAPRLRNVDVWPDIVTGSQRLVSEGIAQQALALGWSPYDLFGVWPDAVVCNDWESLAVWVRDGSPVILGSKMAAVRTATGRAWYHRRALPDGVKYLWELS